MDEHPAIQLLRRYDALKAELLATEQQLNRECSDYGRNVLGVWGFAPSHLRQRLAALEKMDESASVGQARP
jgi:hypothetical protein